MHFRAEDDVHAGETLERQHGFLHAGEPSPAHAPGVQFLQRPAKHDLRGKIGQRHAGGLGHKRGRARGAGVDFQNVDVVALDGELYVHQTDDAQFLRQRLGLRGDKGHMIIGERIGRQDAGGISGMDARLLDMFHDARHIDVRAV